MLIRIRAYVSSSVSGREFSASRKAEYLRHFSRMSSWHETQRNLHSLSKAELNVEDNILHSMSLLHQIRFNLILNIRS